MSHQRPATDTSASPACPSLPKVAVVLLWYPLFTQPFIFRDVEALRTHLPLEVHTLYGLNLRLCSEEMRQAAPGASRLGLRALPRILLSFLRLACTRPRTLARVLAANLAFRWPSLEICGENLWACLAGIHLAPLFREHRIDFIYAPWPRGTTTAARTISMLTGIPYVTSARGDNLNPADPDLAVKLRDARLVRTNNLADADRIRDLAGQAFPGHPIRVEVIYNSLTLKADSPAPVKMERPVRLLAAGRFDVTKGFDVLLRACALLRDGNVPFTLTLVGGGGKMLGLGNLETSLHELCTSLDLDGHVSFPGLVSHEVFPDILRSHDIFVAPCVIAPDGQRDGIPNTVIEAMSFGLPVVASDINALPELVRDHETGLLVPQGSPEALARALASLVEQPELARELGRNAARLARDLFSPQTNGRRLADLFVRAHLRQQED